eukprot:gene7119-8537_t
MAAALERVAGPAATALLDRTPEPTIRRIVKSWPGRFDTPRARALGLGSDDSFDAVIRERLRMKLTRLAAGLVLPDLGGGDHPGGDLRHHADQQVPALDPAAVVHPQHPALRGNRLDQSRLLRRMDQ